MESRRYAIKKMLAGAGALTLPLAFSESFATTQQVLGAPLNSKINHSVCRWCYESIPFETFIIETKKLGIKSIELVGEQEWPLLKKHGITCALPWGEGMTRSIDRGFNDPANHEELIKGFTDIIPKVRAAGYDKIICFSGNRRGISEIDGMINCAKGIKKLIPIAEKYNVTLVMELLNSKVDHLDYMCDSTAWGVALCDMVGSERLKLLYDIYHMQIMEGDVISTIQKYHTYFAHYHTGGVPGRNEIDDTQELNFPAIMRAIVQTGYWGYIGQEFVPKKGDKIASLKQGIGICNV